MLRQATRDETPKTLFNPTLYDFTVQIADDANNPREYVIPAQEIEIFPAYIAEHIKKKLAEKIYLERTEGKVTKESIMPSILEEIEPAI